MHDILIRLIREESRAWALTLSITIIIWGTNL